MHEHINWMITNGIWTRDESIRCLQCALHGCSTFVAPNDADSELARLCNEADTREISAGIYASRISQYQKSPALTMLKGTVYRTGSHYRWARSLSVDYLDARFADCTAQIMCDYLTRIN